MTQLYVTQTHWKTLTSFLQNSKNMLIYTNSLQFVTQTNTSGNKTATAFIAFQTNIDYRGTWL